MRTRIIVGEREFVYDLGYLPYSGLEFSVRELRSDGPGKPIRFRINKVTVTITPESQEVVAEGEILEE